MIHCATTTVYRGGKRQSQDGERNLTNLQKSYYQKKGNNLTTYGESEKGITTKEEAEKMRVKYSIQHVQRGEEEEKKVLHVSV